MCNVDPKVLFARIRSGDDRAAAELLDLYAGRLIALARCRLAAKLTRRLDPEDIVQSACRSFFRQARAGRYEIRESDDLWRLLAAITTHKALHQVHRHSTAKRTIHQEEFANPGEVVKLIPSEAFARDPLPADAAMLIEETELMMGCLSPRHRRILELTLQGHDVDQAAEQAGCSERTVQRAIEHARTQLEQRLFGRT